jgi:dihydrofolate reductase
MAQTGALLMGRRTYDVVCGFDVEWPYGDTPVYVATTRPLQPATSTVRAISGTPREMLDRVNGEVDGSIYLDGGALIRSFLDLGLVDELTVTVVNHVLGDGIPLFAGVAQAHALELLGATPYESGLVQLRYAVASSRRA